ncbi:MAG: glycosyltransferase [bacterium]|nr:glycosyltransferase [bacterium]
MKIGFFTDGYLPQLDGVGENVSTLATALRQAGQKVYVIAPKHPGFKDKDPNVFRLRSVRVYKKPEWRMALPIPEKDFQKAAKIPFDLIHGHAGGPVSFLGFEIARRRNIPYVFTYHTLWNRYTHYILKGKVLTPKMMEVASKIYCNMCTLIIAPTKRVKKELESYGVTKPIYVISGRLDLDRFRKVEKGYLRKKLRLGKEISIVLYVGRLGKEKSVDLIVKSFSLVAKSKENTRLVIVGDGPEREKLEKLALKESIGKKIFFAGFVNRDQIPLVYKDADIFVFASQTETQGIVVPEALASGLPCVVVDDPAFKEVIIDGDNSLSANNNPKDFSSKIIKLLESPLLRRRLGANAKKFAKANFSIKQQVEEHVEAYRKALILHKNRKTQVEVLKKRFSAIRDFLQVNKRLALFKQVLTKEF